MQSRRERREAELRALDLRRKYNESLARRVAWRRRWNSFWDKAAIVAILITIPLIYYYGLGFFLKELFRFLGNVFHLLFE